MQSWTANIKDLAILSRPNVLGLRRWNHDYLQMSCELAQVFHSLATLQGRCSGQKGDQHNETNQVNATASMYGQFSSLSVLFERNKPMK